MLPQASGMATARTPRMTGAFHGAMPSTTPTGWRTAMASRPGLSDGITSPAICVVIAAASRSMLAARPTLNRAQPSVAPVSSAMLVTNASARASSSAAAAISLARRADGPSADQAGKAAAAAAAAAAASARLAAGARLATSPVSGLRRSNSAASEAARRSSPISRLVSSMTAPLPRPRRLVRARMSRPHSTPQRNALSWIKLALSGGVSALVPLPASRIDAARIAAALAHRTWDLDDPARCRLVLLTGGRAALAVARQPGLQITAPALLWLPHTVRGSLQVLAGGEGFVASAGLDLLQRTLGDPALAVHLRPLLDRLILAGADMLAPHLAAVADGFAGLVSEAPGLRPGAAAMAGLQLAALLLLLWRCAGMPGEAGRRGAGATTAQRYRQLVELHYRDGLRIDAFAARLGVTRAHLHDACLRATGRTPLALLHDRLLAEARTRLEQTDLSVEQVGYGIGFRDPGYFNRFFKRLAGQSPGAYRRLAAAARPAPATPSFAAWP